MTLSSSKSIIEISVLRSHWLSHLGVTAGAGLSVGRKCDVTFVLEERSRDGGEGRMEQNSEDYKVLTTLHINSRTGFESVNSDNFIYDSVFDGITRVYER